MEELALGTKEFLLIDIRDRLKTLTTLDGLAVTYDVKDSAGVSKYTNQVGQNTGMRAECLIDTTGWSADTYSLWVMVVIGSEKPRLGPFEFIVR